MPFLSIKRYLRRQRLKRRGVFEELQVNRLALAYEHGGWMICPDGIGPASVVYSFGVGTNVAWDLAMIERFGCTIHAFDPTPRSVRWVRTQHLPPQFVFHDLGIANVDGEKAFYPPRRATSTNYSPIDRGQSFDGKEVVKAPVARLQTIMRRLGHDHIDLLKMDIEGGEYNVIDDMLACNLDVRQFIVEFHHNFRTVPLQRTVDAVASLRRAGFSMFHVSDRSYEMSFLRPGAPRSQPG